MQDNQSTTSVNTLPFQEDFETQVNENMNPSRHSSSQDCKAPMPLTSPDEFEAQDQEFNEKMAMKDRHHLPPRFSTLFETKRPATPTREFESYPQQPPRKSGVCLPKPVFWALFAIFLFETAALFAYTVIGLMNNMPSKLIHTNSAGVVVSGCDCSPQPINISPNFFMPGASQAPVIETTTASVSTSTTASSTSSTSSSTSSTSSSSSSSESVKSGISELADIIKSAVPTSTSESSTVKGGTAVVTVTPPGPTIKSTVLLTVDPSGSTIAPPPTTTSIVWVTPTSTHETRDEPTSVVSTTSAPEPATSTVPFDTPMMITLKSHQEPATSTVPFETPVPSQELANQPTQEARDVPSSATSLASSGLSETVSTPTAFTLIQRDVPTSTKTSNSGIVVSGERPDLGWRGLHVGYEQADKRDTQPTGEDSKKSLLEATFELD